MSPVEQQIQQAQRDGAFDDLPGKGKPLRNLSSVYDPGCWAADLVKREAISLLPPALALRQTIERELARLDTLRSEEQVREVLEKLNAEIRRINAGVTSGPSTTVTRLDVESFVARWRER